MDRYIKINKYAILKKVLESRAQLPPSYDLYNIDHIVDLAPTYTFIYPTHDHIDPHEEPIVHTKGNNPYPLEVIPYIKGWYHLKYPLIFLVRLKIPCLIFIPHPQ